MAIDYALITNALVNTNTQLLQALVNINKSVDVEAASSSIDTKKLVSLSEEGELINKKIKDNVATINKIAFESSYPGSFFTDIQNKFNKSVLYISDTLPSTILSGSTISGEVIFSNEGMFYSWTSEKSIKLRIKIEDFDSNVFAESIYAFDSAYPSNIPGDVNINGDFGLQKIFAIQSFVVPSIVGQYNLLMGVEDDEYVFLNGTSKYITIE